MAGGLDHDDLFGGNGSDTFVFSETDTYDEIHDFNLGDGDKLDISDLLSAYDPMTDLLTDFVKISDNGTDSYLQIDVDGGADSFTQIARIIGTTGLTDEDALLTSGNLVVA
ncbi:MAG: type I secretion C-terminal target domain-containing protein [Alphaproteobacteria bacterium]|nr:type I secretion C-terminal target domain-containing protein [Alphaproteobacteria bacterium]